MGVPENTVLQRSRGGLPAQPPSCRLILKCYFRVDSIWVLEAIYNYGSELSVLSSFQELEIIH